MLPNRLTTYHVEMAKQRGDKGIIYLGKFWSIEELERLDGNGNKRAKGIKSQPKKDRQPIKSSDKDSTGDGSK